eukprot:154159_1
MRRIMKSKQKTLTSIRHSFDINCNKFITQIPNEDDDEDDDPFEFGLKPVSNGHKRCQTTMNMKRLSTRKAPLRLERSKSELELTQSAAVELQSLAQKQDMNEFGIGFTYWKDEETAHKIYLKHKYSNLKQEILCNKICTISRSDWDDTFCAAHNLLLSEYGKQLIADLTESQVA